MTLKDRKDKPSVWSGSERLAFAQVSFLPFREYQKSDFAARYKSPLATRLRPSILMSVYVNKVLFDQRRELFIFE
jgi:hypothetical protein